MSRMIQAALVLMVTVAILAMVAARWNDIVPWVQAEQRDMQTQLARTIQSIRSGNQFAIASLIGICFTYGLLHAIGPGHGKLLIGGAAVASQRTAWRMATIGFFSSLMQAVSAITLAYGGLGLASATGSAIIGSADGFLMRLSFLAMALVGLWLMMRGARLICVQPSRHAEIHETIPHSHDNKHLAAHSSHTQNVHHAHSGVCAAGCKHMPTVDETEKIEGWRDIFALVLSIGIRPCSGALILLIIAWHLDLYAIGALGTFAMAVGTGLVVGLVAIFAITIRDFSFFRRSEDGGTMSSPLLGQLQLLVGGVVIITCVAFIFTSFPEPTPMGFIR